MYLVRKYLPYRDAIQSLAGVDARRSGALALLSLVLTLAPSNAHAADLLISFGDQTRTASGGTFEVDLTNTSTTQTYGVASFSLELTLDPSSGAQFTGASTNTASSYIFDGTGVGSIDPTFDLVASMSATDLIAGDTEFTNLEIDVAPSATFGLALVSYSGTLANLSAVQLGLATDLSDGNGNAIPLINNSGAVPEPSSLLMLALASATLLAARWRDHR
jgi:hypothetical protein